MPNSFKVSGMSDTSDNALSIRLEQAPLAELIDAAGGLRDEGHGRNHSYSRKVFIPLTHLCRDVCHYCTFAERPRAGRPAYLSADEVVAIARAGAAAGCTEACSRSATSRSFATAPPARRSTRSDTKPPSTIFRR